MTLVWHLPLVLLLKELPKGFLPEYAHLPELNVSLLPSRLAKTLKGMLVKVVLELDYVICHMVSRLANLVMSWSQG